MLLSFFSEKFPFDVDIYNIRYLNEAEGEVKSFATDCGDIWPVEINNRPLHPLQTVRAFCNVHPTLGENLCD